LSEVNIITFDEERHKERLYELFREYSAWGKNQIQKMYGFDHEIILGGAVEDILQKVIPVFISLKPPDGIILILEVDGKAMGMGRLSKLDEGIVEINNMFVSSRHRGKGYGKMMLRSLEDKAREFGYSTVRLDTGAFNVAAQHMYRKAGYIERDYYGSTNYGRVAKDDTEEGRIYYANKIYMEKKL
jgi:ribosomal protein S18 acetylase RimI-like enzyme